MYVRNLVEVVDSKEEIASFLDLSDIDAGDIRSILKAATKMKNDLKNGGMEKPLEGKHLAMIFEKPSTRTRVSFEVGMNQLGGQSVIMDSTTSQLGRGETVADTARVLSRYVDIIMVRCFSHETLLEMAEYATVPVINGLTDYSHPCQVMADILTYEEHRGSIEGKTVAWVGDCNNMVNSWIHASEKLSFSLKIGAPQELSPPSKALPENVSLFTSAEEAVKDADLVCTDTWFSMGDDTDADYKKEILGPYQINTELMSFAKNDALFMHCLPAHRGDEVVDDVMDGPQSVIWDEAENRLHVQKAIMLWCMGR